MNKTGLKLLTNSKVNIHLQITGKTKNEYHNLKMINQTINLSDVITVRKTLNKSINIKTENLYIKREENIVYRLCELIDKNICPLSLDIDIIKNIPNQAGLGGGSTDCAAALYSINELYNLKLDKGTMVNIVKNIGADVPFFLYGGTAIVEGIGDKIIPIESDIFYYIIIKPDFSVSTKDAYKKYDLSDKENFKNTKKIISNVNNIDKLFILDNCYNDFDTLLSLEYDIIDKIKGKLYKNNAFYAQLSGSGSSIYGMYDDKNTRDFAFGLLKKEFKQIYKCESTDHTFKIEEIYE